MASELKDHFGWVRVTENPMWTVAPKSSAFPPEYVMFHEQNALEKYKENFVYFPSLYLWPLLCIFSVMYNEYHFYFLHFFFFFTDCASECCVSVWSAVLFRAWPREALQLACAGRQRWVERWCAAFIVNAESLCVCVCESRKPRLWCKALSASSLSSSSLRVEFASLPIVPQSGKTSWGNLLDRPIMFLLQHSWA